MRVAESDNPIQNLIQKLDGKVKEIAWNRRMPQERRKWVRLWFF